MRLRIRDSLEQWISVTVYSRARIWVFSRKTLTFVDTKASGVDAGGGAVLEAGCPAPGPQGT